MKKSLFLLLLSPYLLAIQCPDQECALIENWEQNSFVQLLDITPIQSSYNAGDTITLTASIPATNQYFGEEVNLLEASGDETGLMQLITYEGRGDLFQENQVTIKKGAQGRFPFWFDMQYNAQTSNYELKVDIILKRTGSYTMLADGYIEFGSSDCPDYRLNFIFAGIEDQFLEFTVNE